MERLLREHGALADVIVAYDAFHAALDRFHNTAYKGDAAKAVDAAREEMKRAREAAEPIIKARKGA